MENDMDKRLAALQNEFGRFVPDATEMKLFYAPGRINIIGEHTDYNGGLVLPTAIDISIIAAARKRNDRMLNLNSMNFTTSVSASLDDLQFQNDRDWANFPLSAAWALENSGRLCSGADIVFQGDIPLGSGLSSSAAIEVLMMKILLSMSEQEIEKQQIPLLCRKGENDFIGVKCGIMDQYIITFGKKGHAVYLDCSDLKSRLVPFAKADTVAIVVGNTKVKRELAKSAYNQRVEECAEGVTTLKTLLGRTTITTLSDITLNEFNQHKEKLSATIAQRCEHVIEENARVEKATVALETGNLEQLGALLNASHDSLKNLYEVSCVELDVMVDAFIRSEGVYGARMTGAGFGGSTIALVKTEYAKEVIETVRDIYKEKTGINGDFYIAHTANGVSEFASPEAQLKYEFTH